jgi:hypothetical protein
MRNMEQAGPQADQPDEDQVNRDNVIENARDKKDQYACDQRDQRLDYEDVKCHRQIPEWRQIVGEDLTGGCLCGDTRYRITAAPVEAQYCHCRMCQRAHGAPVIAWLTVPLDAFAVTKGNPVAHRSSAKAFRHFCGGCGTPLTWREADNPRLVDVSIGSLDNPEAIAPTMHVWTDSRIAWFESADHLPRYPTNERPKTVL